MLFFYFDVCFLCCWPGLFDAECIYAFVFLFGGCGGTVPAALFLALPHVYVTHLILLLLLFYLLQFCCFPIHRLACIMLLSLAS